jgi:2,5-diketo-D-gluconate reductase B
VRSLTLSNGRQMPVLGLGTWRLQGAACQHAVRTALDLGYRLFDTAEMYGNEQDVAAALAASHLDRGDVFLTTKVSPSHFRAPALRGAAEDSLRRLRTDYVDLLLLHWPSRDVPLAETLGSLGEVALQGKARAVGVSNFSPAQLREAVSLSPVPIACNQGEYHVLVSRRTLLDYARSQQIAVTAYSPLAQGRLARHPVLARIGARYGKSAAQVALRWLVEQDGVATIPKASGERNLRANLDLFDFSLDAEDSATLASLAEGS